jgi:hypothetical protein
MSTPIGCCLHWMDGWLTVKFANGGTGKVFGKHREK